MRERHLPPGEAEEARRDGGERRADARRSRRRWPRRCPMSNFADVGGAARARRRHGAAPAPPRRLRPAGVGACSSPPCRAPPCRAPRRTSATCSSISCATPLVREPRRPADADRVLDDLDDRRVPVAALAVVEDAVAADHEVVGVAARERGGDRHLLARALARRSRSRRGRCRAERRERRRAAAASSTWTHRSQLRPSR